MKVFEGLHAFLWTSPSANNCNCFLIDGPARVLIDPGHASLFEHVELNLRQLHLGIEDLDLVISTHAHPDHIEALSFFKDTPALVTTHREDWELIKQVGGYLGGALDIEASTPDFFLTEGELVVKGLKLEIIHTPGHSPGSVSILWRDTGALFTGDVIFRDGLGRTDLPGGDGEALKTSIKRLAGLGAEWLLPGHGGIVSGAELVKANFENVERYWFAYL